MQIISRNLFALSLVASTSLLLSACGDDASPSMQVSAPETAAAKVKETPVAIEEIAFVMVKGLGLPPQGRDAYREPSSPNQIGWLYHAHAQSVKQAEDAIELISPYAEDEPVRQMLLNAASSDPFIQRDNMPKALAFAEEKIKEAAASPWYKIMMPAELEPYDFDRKGFQFNSAAFAELGSQQQESALLYLNNS